MERFLAYMKGLSVGGAFLSVAFMLLIVLLILVEIVLRSVFGSSTQVASEFSGYFMVALVLFGFAYALGEGAFIRIGLLTPKLPKTFAKWLDVLVAILALGITVYALVYSVDMVYESFSLDMRADTMAETPFWIPQSVVPLGLALLGLELVAYTVRRVFQS